jgi:hypothetical protein
LRSGCPPYSPIEPSLRTMRGNDDRDRVRAHAVPRRGSRRGARGDRHLAVRRTVSPYGISQIRSRRDEAVDPVRRSRARSKPRRSPAKYSSSCVVTAAVAPASGSGERGARVIRRAPRGPECDVEDIEEGETLVGDDDEGLADRCRMHREGGGVLMDTSWRGRGRGRGRGTDLWTDRRKRSLGRRRWVQSHETAAARSAPRAPRVSSVWRADDGAVRGVNDAEHVAVTPADLDLSEPGSS